MKQSLVVFFFIVLLGVTCVWIGQSRKASIQIQTQPQIVSPASQPVDNTIILSEGYGMTTIRVDNSSGHHGDDLVRIITIENHEYIVYRTSVHLGHNVSMIHAAHCKCKGNN